MYSVYGKRRFTPTPVLTSSGEKVTSPPDVADLMALTFRDRCSNAAQDPSFVTFRMQEERRPINFGNDNSGSYALFSMSEMEAASKGLKNVSPGSDQITNEMSLHLPEQ